MSYLKLRRGALVAALAAGAITGSVALSVPASAESNPASSTAAGRPLGLGLDPIGDVAASALSLLDIGGVLDPRYTAERDMLAAAVASRVGLDTLALQTAWQQADVVHQRALFSGLTQLGVRYRKNTSREGEGFDCSGLTTFAWGRAGVGLTRQSGVQIRNAAPRTIDTAEAGDLVYYPGHISLWLGLGHGVLHAPQPGQRVEVKIQGGNRSLRLGDPTG